MVNSLVLFYFAAGTLLFFFWVYGIVSFVRDLKNTFIPKYRQYRRGRKKLKEQQQQDEERQEKEEQLL